MGNVFDVNIEGIKDNKYNIDVDLFSNDISVEVIKEERLYDISIETANFPSLVSPNDGNRLKKTVEGGLFVPEIDFDIVSIYEEAKL